MSLKEFPLGTTQYINPVTNTLYFKTQDGVLLPPPGFHFLITEDDFFLITEDGDYLITES